MVEIIHNLGAVFEKGPNGEILFPELKDSEVDFESLDRGRGPSEA